MPVKSPRRDKHLHFFFIFISAHSDLSDFLDKIKKTHRSARVMHAFTIMLASILRHNLQQTDFIPNNELSVNHIKAECQAQDA